MLINVLIFQIRFASDEMFCQSNERPAEVTGLDNLKVFGPIMKKLCRRLNWELPTIHLPIRGGVQVLTFLAWIKPIYFDQYGRSILRISV